MCRDGGLGGGGGDNDFHCNVLRDRDTEDGGRTYTAMCQERGRDSDRAEKETERERGREVDKLLNAFYF